MLAYGANNWKAHQIATDNYPSWRAHHLNWAHKVKTEVTKDSLPLKYLSSPSSLKSSRPQKKPQISAPVTGDVILPQADTGIVKLTPNTDRMKGKGPLKIKNPLSDIFLNPTLIATATTPGGSAQATLPSSLQVSPPASATPASISTINTMLASLTVPSSSSSANISRFSLAPAMTSTSTSVTTPSFSSDTAMTFLSHASPQSTDTANADTSNTDTSNNTLNTDTSNDTSNASSVPLTLQASSVTTTIPSYSSATDIESNTLPSQQSDTSVKSVSTPAALVTTLQALPTLLPPVPGPGSTSLSTLSTELTPLQPAVLMTEITQSGEVITPTMTVITPALSEPQLTQTIPSSTRSKLPMAPLLPAIVPNIGSTQTSKVLEGLAANPARPGPKEPSMKKSKKASAGKANNAKSICKCEWIKQNPIGMEHKFGEYWDSLSAESHQVNSLIDFVSYLALEHN
ncbi:hypothetical protein C0992_003709 [Termitomyces sp. T32_za158]|nr:hypothetical protein C0992_003709 [Termitomyces sp. T32_za158]